MNESDIHSMNASTKSHPRHPACGGRGGGIFMGGAFIIVGAAFLMAQTGHLPPGINSAWDMWPALLLWGGLVNLLRIPWGGSPGCGILLTAVGGAFSADALGYVDLRWELIWPALIILVGLMIFVGTVFGRRSKRRKVQSSVNNARFETDIVMGGGEDEVHTQEFEGGYVSCVMGGLDLDMRAAEIKGDEALMEVRLIMGGLELHVPPHWEVISRCSPVMGAVENKIRRFAGQKEAEGRPPKRLIIDGTVVMGGIEILH